jgi:glutaredoxin 3
MLLNTLYNKEVNKMAKVTVYSTPSCPWCHKAKDFLKANNIEFEDKDVYSDDSARNEMIEKSGQMGVPVIVIEGNDPIVGFDQEAIKKALKL